MSEPEFPHGQPQVWATLHMGNGSQLERSAHDDGAVISVPVWTPWRTAVGADDDGPALFFALPQAALMQCAALLSDPDKQFRMEMLDDATVENAAVIAMSSSVSSVYWWLSPQVRPAIPELPVNVYVTDFVAAPQNAHESMTMAMRIAQWNLEVMRDHVSYTEQQVREGGFGMLQFTITLR